MVAMTSASGRLSAPRSMYPVQTVRTVNDEQDGPDDEVAPRAVASCVRSAFECAVLCRCVRHCASPSDQVEQREEEDPDQVDEVPVQRAQLDRHVVVGRVLALASRAVSHPEQHRHADDDVERVQAGGQEVDGEEEVGARILRQLRGRVNHLPGQRADVELVRVLEVLDDEEAGRRTAMVNASIPSASLFLPTLRRSSASATVKLLVMSTSVLIVPSVRSSVPRRRA